MHAHSDCVAPHESRGVWVPAFAGTTSRVEQHCARNSSLMVRRRESAVSNHEGVIWLQRGLILRDARKSAPLRMRNEMWAAIFPRVVPAQAGTQTP